MIQGKMFDFVVGTVTVNTKKVLFFHYLKQKSPFEINKNKTYGNSFMNLKILQ